jgi:Leucine-rich repeat (LRR) protein
MCTLTFDELSSVKVLRLSYNNIEKFDFEILKQLSSLEKLDLSHNKLSEIQNQENTSPTLLELYLNKNNIRQIEAYEGLKHFQKLQVLGIDYEIFKDPNDFDKLDSIIGEEYVVNVKIKYKDIYVGFLDSGNILENQFRKMFYRSKKLFKRL